MPHDLLDPNPANTIYFIMMAVRAYSTNNTWFIEYEVIGPPEQKKQYEGEVIQKLLFVELLYQRTINLMCLI